MITLTLSNNDVALLAFLLHAHTGTPFPIAAVNESRRAVEEVGVQLQLPTPDELERLYAALLCALDDGVHASPGNLAAFRQEVEHAASVVDGVSADLRTGVERCGLIALMDAAGEFQSILWRHDRTPPERWFAFLYLAEQRLGKERFRMHAAEFGEEQDR